jgi:hypothetical protein
MMMIENEKSKQGWTDMLLAFHAVCPCVKLAVELIAQVIVMEFVDKN